MTEKYGPATITPINEVQIEPIQQPRVNGFSNQVNIIPNNSIPSSIRTITDPVPTDIRAPEPFWNGEQICCLIDSGRKCTQIAGNASYSKRIEKTVAQRKLKLQMDNKARHLYICDHHKNVIQSVRTKRRRRESEDDSGETDSEHPEVDLYQLQVNTLRRYKKQFKVQSRPGVNKAQLADNLMRHFKTISVNEKEVLTYFVYMIKTNRSKLDGDRRDDD